MALVHCVTKQSPGSDFVFWTIYTSLGHPTRLQLLQLHLKTNGEKLDYKHTNSKGKKTENNRRNSKRCVTKWFSGTSIFFTLGYEQNQFPLFHFHRKSKTHKQNTRLKGKFRLLYGCSVHNKNK